MKKDNKKYIPVDKLTNVQLEQKIMSKYTKENPQPQTLKERVEQELNKLKK